MGEEKKILILYNSIPYLLSHFESNEVHASTVLRELNTFGKLLRKLSRFIKLDQTIWYNDWKFKLGQVEKVIIFARLKEIEVIPLIKNFNPNIKIIYWYWNPVQGVGKLDSSFERDLEIWSFDPEDCRMFGYRYNTTFYFSNIELPKNEIEYDALFVGREKGRRSVIDEINKKLQDIGCRTKSIVIPNGHAAERKLVPYKDYLDLLSRTKAIIDIKPKGQSGLTIRPMESIFLKKKLITNDTGIRSHDFYKSDNVFVIGEDDESRLSNFIESDYVSLDEEIVKRYDVREWIKRFD